DPPRGEVGHRQALRLGDPGDQLDRHAVLDRLARERLVVQAAQTLDAAADRAHVAHRLHDVAGPRLALGADHRRALIDPPESLAQIPAPADEGRPEAALVDVELLVRRRQHLTRVDAVDLEGLEDLRLDEVADA